MNKTLAETKDYNQNNYQAESEPLTTQVTSADNCSFDSDTEESVVNDGSILFVQTSDKDQTSRFLDRVVSDDRLSGNCNDVKVTDLDDKGVVYERK